MRGNSRFYFAPHAKRVSKYNGIIVRVKREKKVDVLFLRKSGTFFQIGAGAETGVDFARDDDGACGPILGFGMDVLDLGAQLGEELARYGVSGCWAIERENADGAAVGRGDAGYF